MAIVAWTVIGILALVFLINTNRRSPQIHRAKLLPNSCLSLLSKCLYGVYNRYSSTLCTPATVLRLLLWKRAVHYVATIQLRNIHVKHSSCWKQPSRFVTVTKRITNAQQFHTLWIWNTPQFTKLLVPSFPGNLPPGWHELLSFPSNPHCFLVTNTETSLLSVAEIAVIYIHKPWKHKLSKLYNILLAVCSIFSCAKLLRFCRTTISHQFCICFKQP